MLYEWLSGHYITFVQEQRQDKLLDGRLIHLVAEEEARVDIVFF